MATKRSVGDLKEADLKGKRVFVRVDLKVPLDDNLKITDDTRIRADIPTIKYLMDHGISKIAMATEPFDDQPFDDSATLLCAFSDKKLMSRLFRMWKEVYGKTYSSKEEERYRRQIFMESARGVYENNTRSGSHHIECLNHFADLTSQEMRRYRGRASQRPPIS